MKNNFDSINNSKNKKSDEHQKSIHPTDLYVTKPSDPDVEQRCQVPNLNNNKKGLLLKPTHKIIHPLNKIDISEDVPVIQARKNNIYTHPPPISHNGGMATIAITESENDDDVVFTNFQNQHFTNLNRLDGARIHRINKTSRENSHINKRYSPQVEYPSQRPLSISQQYHQSFGVKTPPRTAIPTSKYNQSSMQKNDIPKRTSLENRSQSIIKPKPITDKNTGGPVYQQKDRNKHKPEFRLGKNRNKNNNNSVLHRYKTLRLALPGRSNNSMKRNDNKKFLKLFIYTRNTIKKGNIAYKLRKQNKVVIDKRKTRIRKVIYKI